ncbi:MAG: BMP family ABC transporter substrate-binding protein [Actinomycetota bacterium]|nr:BMP family ABC transporter substrate-binding protein [Actinomycetota bacterium]
MRLPGENLRFGLAALGVALLLAACGGDGDSGSGATTAEGIQKAEFKIGLVTDVGQLNDRGFNQLAHEGLKRAEKELDVEIRVAQSNSAADYIPNHTSLARQGYDLVIGVGFSQGDAVDAAAVKLPDARFAIVDVDQQGLKNKPANVVGLLFKEQEAGYLAGYLAGLEEKRRPGPDVVSSVGGFKEPPVDRFIAGYQAGAEEAAPGVKAINGYSQTWDDQAKCKEVALNQIQRGAGVVFQVAGGCGLGALDAAKDRGVWGIGVDADQSFLGPFVLTSAMKRVDEAVFRTIKSVTDGTWEGGRSITFGLKDDGVGIGKVSSKVPKEDIDALKSVEDRIRSGEIQVPSSVS